MHPALLPAGLVFSVALATGVYVASYREKVRLHWILIATVASLAVWTLGTLCRFSVTSQAGLEASLRLIFLGVFAAPPLWLALAASYAPLRMAERPGFYAALFAPSLAAYVALVTNDGHHLVIREVSFAALERGGVAWAGPVFWGFLAWSWLCVLAGMAIYLKTAGRMVAGRERRRGLLLAAASLVPLAASPIYMLRLLPVSFDLTPSALLLSLLISSTAVFRYRLLESLPVARRDVIEHLEDGVVIASRQGVILDLNPAAVRILGGGGQPVRRRLLADVLAELAPEEKSSGLRQALAELPSRSEPLYTELRTAADRRIAIQADCARDGAGGIAGLFAVLCDRTEERRFERMLRRTQRLQTAGTLAAGIAHEVNNPLAFIRANLSHIQRLGQLVENAREGSDAKLRDELADLAEIADETLDGIGRIERIIADMRRLSADREADAEPRAEVDLNAVVRDAVRLANLHRAPGLALALSLAEDATGVQGDPERLTQALINLLLNASQALEGTPGPQVWIATRRDAEGLRLRVSDNGPGVPREHQERIFDPFFTTKGPDRGSGLGLSIAYDIVRDHGGTLEVRPRPGGGAEFTARLPLARDRATA